ncbi:MAG: hypothetical protein ACXWUG_17455 [Polyangiales bacterium]
MTDRQCPPLTIDAPLARMIEDYRTAKACASKARRQARGVEDAGHYDKDTPLQTRTAQEGEALVVERAAAIKLADELVSWVDRNR